jgi:hypothetical protein
MRLYLTDASEAMKQAPQYYAAFENIMVSHPDIHDILLQARRDIELYKTQSPELRVLSNISVGEKRTRKMSLDRLYTLAVDELKPIQRFVQKVEKVIGKLDTTENPLVIAWLGRGWVGRAETFIHYGVVDQNYNKISKSLREILEPVNDELDNFRAYIVSKRAIELHDRDITTPIEYQDAIKTIEKFESAKFKKTFEELIEYQDALIGELINAGMLDDDAAIAMKELNKNYVPFDRVFNESSQASYGFSTSKFANLGAPVKRIGGSGRDIIDPLESIIKNTFFMINIAERNKVGRAIVEAAEKAEGAGELVERVAPPVRGINVNLEEMEGALQALGVDTQGIDLDKIVTIFRTNPLPVGKENILTVWRNGKREFYQVEPELYNAVLTLDSQSTDLLIKLLSIPAKTLRVGATTTFEFMVRNPIKDIMTAMVYSKYGFNPTDFAKGLFHVIKQDDIYWKWKAAGGSHGAMVSLDRDYLQGSLRKLLSKGKVTDVLKSPIEVLRALSEFGEEATRLGEFAKGLKYEQQTPSGIMQAALASRDVALDFSRIGTAIKTPNKIIAFFNAAIQSQDKMIRAFKENPKRTLLRCFIYITLPSLISYFFVKDDERYQELPQWEKDLYWFIPTKERLYKIPKPFELGVIFGTLPERILSYICHHNKDAFENYMNTLAGVIFPDLLISAYTGWVEATTNYWFFADRPIVPRSEEKLEPRYQYGPHTSETAKVIGNALNVSPRKVDHMLRAHGGGLAKYGTSIVDSLINIMSKEEKPSKVVEPADIPFVSAFVPRLWSNSHSINKFYEEYAAAEIANNNAKLGKPLNQSDEERRAKLKHYRSVAEDLANLRLSAQTIYASKELSSEKKKEQIDIINIISINKARAAIGKKPINIDDYVKKIND